MAAPWQGLPVRLERAPHRGAAFALSNASKRARTRSIGSGSRSSAVNLAPAVRHGCRSAGLACPLGSSTAAGSSVRHNQGLKARPHALNRFALAHNRFIAHFRPSPRRHSSDPTCADSGAQVLPPARATVPPSLRESSSRVSSLLACYALGPPASAAQYSCRREPCTGRSAWLPLGRACLSAWIEYRSGEQRSP